MDRFALYAAVFLVGLVPVRVGFAQWAAPAAAPVGALEFKPAAAAYRWVKNASVPGEVYLYRGNVQVGGYSFETGFYLPLEAGRWGKPAIAPVRPPLEGLEGQPSGYTFGVLAGEVSQTEHIECRDKVRTYGEAVAMLADEVPNDAKQPRLTVLARDAALRDRIKNDWQSAHALAGERDKWALQVYDPASAVTRAIMAPFRLEDNKALADKGLVIIAQASAGEGAASKVLGSWSDYLGADELAAALRKVQPDYDPNKPAVPGPLPVLPAAGNFDLVLVGGLVLVVLVLMVRSRGQ